MLVLLSLLLLSLLSLLLLLFLVDAGNGAELSVQAYLRPGAAGVGAVDQGLEALADGARGDVLSQQGGHRRQDLLQPLLIALEAEDLQLQVPQCAGQGASLHKRHTIINIK